MSSFRTELVTTPEAFAGLKEPWNALVDKMECPEIFYRWEWNFHYFQNYRTHDRLFILVVWHSSGTIAAIAPFCVRNVRRLGCLARVVDTIVADMADYRNILVHSDYHRGHVVTAVLKCLREQTHRWDVIDISQLCSRDPTTFQIATAAHAYTDWTVRVQMSAPLVVRNLKHGRVVEDGGRLRRVRRQLQILTKQGFHVRIGCADIAELWPAFSLLHRSAWPSSPFHSAQGRAFFDDLIRSDGMRGKIEFSSLEFHGKPVAMHFGFVDSRKVYFYMPTMDRAFRQERVGAVLLSAMVDHYAKTHEVFDFLRGAEDYKAWYTDGLDMNMRIVAHRAASFAAFAYNLPELLHRFAVELGLPKATVQAAGRVGHDFWASARSALVTLGKLGRRAGRRRPTA